MSKKMEQREARQEIVQQVIDSINDGRKAHTLLEEIFHAVGPYGERPMEQALLIKLQTYFGFDDSE